MSGAEETERTVRELRFITYMTPSLPEELYRFLARAAGELLQVETRLAVVTTASGPSRDEIERGTDPFTRDEADVGFVCAPSYLWLHDRPEPRAELLGIAPVFADARNEGRPVYFSDVVVAAASPWQRLEDLRGARWCYNDRQSLSGYFSMAERLEAMGAGPGFFSAGLCAGSHRAAIDQVLEGTAEVAAIDSNVLLFELRRRPEIGPRLRRIASLGPNGIQPIVIRSSASAPLRRRLCRFAQHLQQDQGLGGDLAERFLIRRWAPVLDSHYDAERALLRAETVTSQYFPGGECNDSVIPARSESAS